MLVKLINKSFFSISAWPWNGRRKRKRAEKFFLLFESDSPFIRATLFTAIDALFPLVLRFVLQPAQWKVNSLKSPAASPRSFFAPNYYPFAKRFLFLVMEGRAVEKTRGAKLYGFLRERTSHPRKRGNGKETRATMRLDNPVAISSLVSTNSSSVTGKLFKYRFLSYSKEIET